MEIFTKFNLPTGGAYESDYRDGWALGRKVNYPYHKFTPDTPTFSYDEPESVCRMHVVITDFATGATTQELQCASSDSGEYPSSYSLNTSLAEDAQDATVYWTSPTNARNNNASFPIGAVCTSLMDATTGNVNATAKALCASASSTVTPQFVTYGEPKLVVVYVLYAAVFVFLGLWAAYKTRPIGGDSDSSRKYDLEIAQKLLTEPVTPPPYHKQADQPGANDAASSEIDPGIVQSGYSSSFVGQLVLMYFLLATLALHALVIIVICDYYAKFTPTLFGPHNALVFFLVWLVAALWLAGVVMSQHTVRNFFRLGAPLDKCEYVHMARLEQNNSEGDGEVLLTDRFGVSDLVARVERVFSVFSPTSAHGGIRYQQTVKVQTIDDRRFVEFQHMRYVYDDDARRFIPGTIALSRSLSLPASTAASESVVSATKGLTSFEATRRLNLVGANAVEVTMPSLARSLLL